MAAQWAPTTATRPTSQAQRVGTLLFRWQPIKSSTATRFSETLLDLSLGCTLVAITTARSRSF